MEPTKNLRSNSRKHCLETDRETEARKGTAAGLQPHINYRLEVLEQASGALLGDFQYNVYSHLDSANAHISNFILK